MSENKFNYVYTAPTEEERKEIASIRRQYETEEKLPQTALEKLRGLDRRVRATANAIGLTAGILGCLIFGTGLTMILQWSLFFGGIPVAAFGAVGMAIAYPLHQRALKREKAKHGEEILRLSDQLLKEETGAE